MGTIKGVERSEETGPVIVGVEGSARSADALALTDILAPALDRPVLMVFTHPFGDLASLLDNSA